MVVVDQRVAQIVVFVAVFQNGGWQNGAFLDAQTFGHRTCCDVANDYLQRNDLHFFNNSFTVGQLFYKVGRDAFAFQHLHQMVGNAVVDNAFARDGAFFQTVKSGCIVLVVNDVQLRILGGIDLFCLAFIKHFTLFHFDYLHTSH